MCNISKWPSETLAETSQNTSKKTLNISKWPSVTSLNTYCNKKNFLKKLPKYSQVTPCYDDLIAIQWHIQITN